MTKSKWVKLGAEVITGLVLLSIISPVKVAILAVAYLAYKNADKVGA